MYTPTWLTVPAGLFTMGSDPRDAAQPSADEMPQQRIALPGFRIARVPITNAQYLEFVIATGYPAPGHWRAGQPQAGTEHCPVTYVSWDDAQAFCAWAGARLPSEAEWEKAARGPLDAADTGANDRWWPWGDALPDATRCHFDGLAHGVPPAMQGVVPVGQFPLGASPYGVLDMAGNVWEWTSSLDHAYPYRAEDGREDVWAAGSRVVRGGSYQHDLRNIRCASRHGMCPGARDVYIGFRVAAGDAPSRLDLDWVSIPAGTFLMGSEPAPHGGDALPDETPQHVLHLAEFRIARAPVTNADYAGFTRATGHAAPPHWLQGDVPRGLENHPVTHVDWHDARAFCRWAGARLATEAEWEKAARGPLRDGGYPRTYPWGDAPPSAGRLNYRRGARHSATTAVGEFPRGASPYGALDMAGNVWEWVSSAYAPYPYRSDDGREDPDFPAQRVLRGGSFASPHARFVRCAMRSLSHPTRRREHIGFRVAI